MIESPLLYVLYVCYNDSSDFSYYVILVSICEE